MTKRRASYCPYCGSSLEPCEFEGRERQFCPSCREFVWQNPVPGGYVAVLDGDEVLFVKQDRGPDRRKWEIPGGILEVDEPAAVGAARELEEESGLCVDPDDLELVRTGFDVDDPDDGSYLSICFAVERKRTSGTVVVGSEPEAARFWDPSQLGVGEAVTRSVDRRRVEAAFERLRGEEIVWDRG